MSFSQAGWPWGIILELLVEEVSERTRVHRFREGDAVLSWRSVMHRWSSSIRFRTLFLNALRDAPFEAFFWESTPVSEDTLDRPFAHAIVDAPQLSGVDPDSKAFDEHFEEMDVVVAFPNLRGDAQLVVPTPVEVEEAYAHIARFVRNAPADQQHALLIRIAKELEPRLHSGDPTWVSTSGLGVYWVHVRLDSKPKYYTHGPFRQV